MAVRIILIGLLAGLIMLVVGMGVGQLFNLIDPSLQGMYQNEDIFRAFDNPLMSLFYLYPFVLGVILAWIWVKTRALFPYKNALTSGLVFGCIYGLLAIPGFIINYSSFQITLLMTFSWLIMSLVNGIVAGLIFSKLLKK